MAATSVSVAKPRLGYWKIRGLAQPIRNLLKYLEIEFDDETFEQGDAPDFSRDAWLSVKPSIPCDFPNLPYFLDGETRITQSATILRYIARKYGAGKGLYEGTPEQLAAIDLMFDQTVDLRTSITRAAYGGTSFDVLKASLPSSLDAFEKTLGKDGRDFLTGSNVTIADFALQEVLEQVVAIGTEVFSQDILGSYPRLAAYKARFEALPTIAAYRSSAAFMARPFNNKVAVWK